MTDITTTAPIAIRRPSFPSVRLPKLGLGQALARIAEAFGHALDLAYAQPYRPGRNQSTVVIEGSEEGRDASW